MTFAERLLSEVASETERVCVKRTLFKMMGRCDVRNYSPKKFEGNCHPCMPRTANVARQSRT